MAQGSDVVLQSNTFTLPQRCASCGMPPPPARASLASH